MPAPRMPVRYAAATVSAVALLCGASRVALAQAGDPSYDLLLKAGTPLQVALSSTLSVSRPGQEISGTLLEPVYSYDRIVLPAGAVVRGHVAVAENPRRLVRARAYVSGDFAPHRRIVLQFDTVGLPDGSVRPIRTRVVGEAPHLRLQVAGDAERSGVVARARQEVAERASEAIAAAKAPGKMQRLRDAAIDRLPYHPQFLRQGTVFTAELVAPLDFGMVIPAQRAAADARPAPDTILNARLTTPLGSNTATRGTPIEAVVTHPVFSASGGLIFPEGTRLGGIVTVSRAARRFHRNGQLRFLFQTVRLPDRDPSALLGSLYSVRADEDARIAVDDEGGASATNTKTRFVAPALAILALRGAAEHHGLDHDADDAPGAVPVQAGGHLGSRALGGWFGWGILGVAASQISRPVGIAIGVAGVGRTVYSSVFAKGREVAFPADTVIQVRLAPGSTSAARR